MNLATIERVLEVKNHPNADRLDLVTIMGYQCVTEKGLYRQGDQVVYIKTDTVLPETEWAEGYRKYSPKRVKAVKLRNEWSEGIILPLTELDKVYLSKVMEGVSVVMWDDKTDVSNLLEVTKYEPPVPQDLSAKSSRLPYDMSKTDEERWENMVDKLPFGEKVDVFLKVDGQSATYGYKLDEDRFFITGRTMELYADKENNYTAHVKHYDLENKLRSYCQKYQVSIALRGESYGEGIQGMSKNPHSKLPKGLAIFSVYLIDERKYARKGHQHYFVNVCFELGLPMVPMVENDEVLTQDMINLYSTGIKTLFKNEYFEGVVIQHSKGSFKIINKYYDAEK